MSVTKASGFESDDFLSNLVTDLQTTFAGDSEAADIVDFVENVIDKEQWGITLDPRQMLILKCFYSCDLTDEDLEILESLSVLDRTNFDIERYKREGPSTKLKQALVLECGRRGGKTLIGAIIIAFEFYKLCLKPTPQKYYKIGGNTPIVIYCIATGAEQTKKTIYGQARALLYFVPALKRLIDAGQIIVGEMEVKYPGKLLYIFSGNSKSSSQVGSSVILLVMDEVARFNDDKGESNAIELWSNIGVSGVTFGEDAKRVAISSGWREGDAIQQLIELSKKLEVCESFTSFRLRSWDLNPVLAARDNPIVASEYARNARNAALEFEGIRHTGENSFLDEREVDRAFRGLSCINAIRAKSKDDGLIRLEVESIEPADVKTYMHLDPAVKRDAYAMAFGHLQTKIGEEPIVIIDGLLAWEPDAHNQVSITNVQTVIYEIHKHRHIYKVTADHQHSPETMERLRASGMDAATIYFSRSMQLEMYDCLRKLLHEDRIYFPRNSPWSLKLKDELINLQLINSVKIDHRPEKSKDISDCVAAIAWQLLGTSQATWTNTDPLSFKLSARTVAAPHKVMSGDSFSDAHRELAQATRTKKTAWDSAFSSFDD